MRGLCDSNELISRDEGMHTEMAVIVSKMCENKISQDIVHQMAREAVEIEKNLCVIALNVSLLGMNSTLMCTIY
jgi:ribonucleotide reductase beta subunit family protein with ferritin-like domain